MITVSIPVDTLQEIRAVLIGIEDDLNCNLTPRSERLQYGRELLREALDAPRSFDEAPTVARYFHSIAAE